MLKKQKFIQKNQFLNNFEVLLEA